MVDPWVYTKASETGPTIWRRFGSLMDEWQDGMQPPVDPKPEPDDDEPGLTFSEDFVDFQILDGQDKSQVGGWFDSFQQWGVRTLDDNGDLGVKAYEPPFTHQRALRPDGSVGGLFLRAGWDDDKGVGRAGMISTERLHMQVGGVWEVDLQVNKCPPGYHLACWLVPSDGSWPPELDLFETSGKKELGGIGTGYVNDHGFKGAPEWTKFDYEPGKMYTFRIAIFPERVTWSGKGPGETFFSTIRDRLIPVRKPLYFIASWEVSGKTAGPVTDPDATAEAIIGGVRAYRFPNRGQVVD